MSPTQAQDPLTDTQRMTHQMTDEQRKELELTLLPGDILADIVFVIDTTASMNDKIDGLLQTCARFADEISISKIDYRLALIGFGDIPNQGEDMSVFPFTTSVDLFKGGLTSIPRTHGGPAPESSLEALCQALHYDFRYNALRVVILITDAPPHEPDTHQRTHQDVIRYLKENDILTFCIAPDIPCFRSIAQETGGELFVISQDVDFVSILERLSKSVARRVVEEFLLLKSGDQEHTVTVREEKPINQP